MIEWLQNNWGTLIAVAVIVAIVTLVVVHLIRKKMRGETSCSCGCKECGGCCPGCRTAAFSKKRSDSET